MLPPFPTLFVPNAPKWAQGADLATDYQLGRDYYPLKGMFPPGVDTHAASINAPSSAGVYQSFAANVPVLTNLGLQTVPTRTNSALWCRDLTNAAWAKTTATAAKDQVGVDGAANAASSLTATSGNATALQTIVLASSADSYSVFLRRLTGTGTINITMDGGLTWTPVVLTAAWQRFQVQQTFLNPVFGVQIVTNGDAVAVDFNQLEVGAFASSPILTTTTAATVNGNQQVLSGLGTQLVTGVAGLVQVNVMQPAADFVRLLEFNDNTGPNSFLLSSSGGNLRLEMVAAGVSQASVLLGAWAQGVQTIAFIGTTNYVMGRVVGQSAPSPDTTVTYPVMDRVSPSGSGRTAANNAYSFTRKLALDFPTPSDDPATKFAEWYAKAQLAAAA